MYQFEVGDLVRRTHNKRVLRVRGVSPDGIQFGAGWFNVPVKDLILVEACGKQWSRQRALNKSTKELKEYAATYQEQLTTIVGYLQRALTYRLSKIHSLDKLAMFEANPDIKELVRLILDEEFTAHNLIEGYKRLKEAKNESGHSQPTE